MLLGRRDPTPSWETTLKRCSISDPHQFQPSEIIQSSYLISLFPHDFALVKLPSTARVGNVSVTILSFTGCAQSNCDAM